MKRMTPLIALIDDDIALSAAFSATLTDAGYYTLPCVVEAHAAQVVAEELPDLVIIAQPMGVADVIGAMQQCVTTEVIPVIVYVADWQLAPTLTDQLQMTRCIVLARTALSTHLLTFVESMIGDPPLLERTV